jgi:hypothetical protein
MSLTEIERRAILAQNVSWLLPEKADLGIGRLTEPYWDARRICRHDLFTAVKDIVRSTRAATAGEAIENVFVVDTNVFAMLALNEPDPIEQAITSSLRILDLGEDWDDEGSSSYERTTWERAVANLRSLQDLARMFGRSIPAPIIAPAGNGSIDLYWRDDAGTLLINIPPGQRSVTYHGERNGNQTTGVIKDIEQRPDLVVWLATV